MARCTITLIVLALLTVGCHAEPPSPNAAGLLPQVQTIPLEGVEGRFDHFALDAKTHRLFLAALGNDSVEVIDLTAGKVTHHIRGLAAPQGIAFAPDPNRLAIANDKDGSVRLYDATSLQPLATVDLKDDADNVRYDRASRCFWVGYGDGALAAIDPVSAKRLADVKVDAHPESFQLETHGPRIFVNVPKAGHVAVIDRDKAAVIAKWPLKEAKSNFPMALDEPNHRLFIGCRQPAKFLVLDTDNGQAKATLDIVGDTDDLFYDADAKRIYISGGAGHITVISQSDPDTYAVLGQIPTAPGARTSFFVPGSRTFCVAVPHRADQHPELRVFRAPRP
jgi:DNA-binding beta-propeller fold protein YncE